MSVRPVLAAMTAALVIAFASPAMARESKEEREARYAENLELARAHAGEPVEAVRFLNEPYKFDVLGNHHLLVWQNQRTAWLVDLKQDAGCRYMANSLSISIDMVNEFRTMDTSHGYIVGGNGERCKIEGLRKVDVVAMRAARESARNDSAS
ncbi:DUF6491 family protein [Arenimonas metalli]|nr:DUF6491 family protein [Arenimonas metalli]